MENKKVAIVGSGLIGRSWAMLFCGAGYNVHMYDISKELVSKALEDIGHQLRELEASKMLRGNLSPVEQLALIKGADTLQDCIEGAFYIQECVPENLELKIKIFNDIDQFAGDDAIIASSTSCILPSAFRNTETPQPSDCGSSSESSLLCSIGGTCSSSVDVFRGC